MIRAWDPFEYSSAFWGIMIQAGLEELVAEPYDCLDYRVHIEYELWYVFVSLNKGGAPTDSDPGWASGYVIYVDM